MFDPILREDVKWIRKANKLSAFIYDSCINHSIVLGMVL